MAYFNTDGLESPYGNTQSDVSPINVSDDQYRHERFSQHHSTTYYSSHHETEAEEKHVTQVQVSTIDQASEQTSLSSSTTHRKPFILLWWQEVAACVVAILSFVALIIILRLYQDKPSPSWPSTISLNTIVSIFTTLFEGAVLLVLAEGLGQLKWVWLAEDKERPLEVLLEYDNAIRGSKPGALALIWKLKFTRILTSAGAVIMILAFGIEPLAQQIIQYYECIVPAENLHADIARTNYYSQPIDRGGRHGGAGLTILSPDVQIAINAATTSPNLNPAFVCDRGNCTWTSEYSSVGWCSSCSDVSDELVSANKTWVTNGDYTTWNLTTTIPDGPVVANADYYDSGQLAAMRSTLGSATFVLGKTVLGPIDPMTSAAWSDCNTTAAEQTWRCKGSGAARCRMYQCIKTFSASVDSGKLTEKILGTSDAWSEVQNANAGLPRTTLDTQCLNQNETQALRSLGYAIDNSTRWIAYNYTDSMPDTTTPTDTFPDSLFLHGCVYGIDPFFSNSIAGYLDRYLTGVVSGYNGEFGGPMALQTIYNFGNVSFDRLDEFITNVTTVLTNYIRENGAQGYSAPAVGIANDNKTCVGVRWPYLAFPGAMLLFVLVFFGVVLVKTRPTGGRPAIWKSSTLPMLVQSLSQNAEDAPRGEAEEMGPATELERMETFAKTKKVSLKDLMRGAARTVVEEVKNSYQ